MSREPRVAVIGMAFRSAGGDTPEALWRTIRDGVVAVGLFEPSTPEVTAADATQRIFLECAHRALEDGGYAATGPDTTIGVYGSGGFDLGTAVDVATRAARGLGLTGPVVSVPAGPSAGLLAVHLACQGVRAGDTDLALAGAAALWTPVSHLEHLSPTGECRAFDVAANGTVGGSAVVAVLLKTLERALADRDTVHAVIEGTGAGDDAVARALASCGLTARDVGHVETHGTGDGDEDRTELAALTSAYRKHTDEAGFCAVGAAAPVIGHTGACSGPVGLIKAVLVLRHGEIPPLAGFRRPHPSMPLDDSPFFLPTRPQAWPGDGRPRRAAVHAPGVHVVLAEPPRADHETSQEAAMADDRRPHLEELVHRYTARTPASGGIARRSRCAPTGSGPMPYPLIGRDAAGSRLTDVDGNHYLDMAMGGGTLLFGHEPEFVTEPVRSRLSQGVQLGLRHQESGEAAELLSTMTGDDRVVFAGSGAEAISVALRMAREATGRDRVVRFTGPECLEYGAPESLNVIEQAGDTIAAVFVEPVPSQRLDLASADFLTALRELTRSNGIVLIFDERVTGFRPHVRGAQGHFGVPADLTLYGESIAGGFPFGAITGRADIVDGRSWTADHLLHPVAVVAAHAVLTHLRDHSPGLQDGLNARTDGLVRRLDRFFSDERFPLRLRHFGSMARFDDHAGLALLEHHLLLRGVLMGEGHTAFLSTAHTDDDVDVLYEAITGAVRELRAEGALPPRARRLLIGLCFTDHGDDEVGHVLEVAEHADEQGVHSVWLSDRLGASPVVVAAAVAVRTRRIRIGAPDDPTGNAADWSAIDTLSGGRVDSAAFLTEGLAESYEHAAARGSDVVTDLTAQSVAQLAHNVARYREARAKHGLDEDGGRMVVVLDESALGDSPDSCAALVRTLRAAGVDELAARVDRSGAGLPLLDRLRRAVDGAEPADDNARAWWHEHLGDEPPILRVPTDRPRGSGGVAARASVSAGLRAGPTGRLRAWGGCHGVTPFASVATAWQVVLRRFSGQDDFLIGTTAGARLPVRCSASDSTSLVDAAVRMRDELAEVTAHSAAPPAEDLTPVSIDFGDGRPGAELSLVVTEEDGWLGLRLTYDTALFDEGSVRWYLDHLVLVLEAMGAAQVDLVGDLPMVSGQDAAVLRDFGAGDPLPTPVLLPGAADPPGGGEIAVVHGDERWTRDRLRAAAETLAGRLADAGVGHGDVVALALPRTPAYAAALLAVTSLGAAYLPLDLTQPSARLGAMLADARPAVIVGDDPAGPVPSASPGATFLTVADLPAHTGITAPVRRVAAPGDLISLLYTSGSTGGPKGVETSYGNLAALLAGYQQRYPVGADDRLAWFSSPGFDSAQAEIWPALIHGAQLHIVPDVLRLDPRGLAEWLVRHRITQIIVPTPIGEQLLDQHWPEDTALRRLITGGEQLNRRPASGLPFEVVNVYGPTETTVFVATGTVVAQGPDAPPLGLPMPGTLLEIRDAGGRLLPPGAPGELHIGGPQVATGYRRVPEITALRWRIGDDGIRRYSSGDLVRWRPDGQLQFLGRADDQVQIRGMRVEPAEVTRALLTLDDVHDALVLGSTDPVSGLSALTAHLCPREMPADQASAIRSWRSRLAGLVPGPMVPERWEVSDRLPSTASGKRDRVGLRRSDAAVPVAEPEGREAVRAAWRQVLDTDDIPDDVPFYDLGGHSLAVMRLLDLMEQRSGVRLSLADFFDDPTVDGIARRFGDRR